MGQLDGKVAIVTGGGTNIGKSIALAMAKEGAKLALAARREALLREVASEIVASGGEAIAVKVDITDKGQVEALGKTVIDAFGRIDVLVANAAYLTVQIPFLEVAADELDRMINTNLKGTFFCCQMAARYMIQGGRGGSLITISSGQGLMPIPGSPHYSATKGAIIALTRSLAAELGPFGIRVNCIAAGLTQKENWKISPQAKEALERQTALRRIGAPADYGGIAVLLASDASSYITAATIPVDGGVTSCRSDIPV